MSYKKPEIWTQSNVLMAVCKPASHPSGRPCKPGGPGGR